MSLISEALKRLDEQHGATGKSPPVPQTLFLQGRKLQRRRLFLIGGAALVSGAFATGLIIYLSLSAAPVRGLVKTDLSPTRPVLSKDISPAGETRKTRIEPVQQISGKTEGRSAGRRASEDTNDAGEDSAPAPKLQEDESTIPVKRPPDAVVSSPELTATVAVKKKAHSRPQTTATTGRVQLDTQTLANTTKDYHKAVALQKQGKLQEALKQYRRLAQHQPMSAELYNNIGVICERQGDLEEAAECYRKAIEIDPRFYPSFNNLGIVFYRLKQYGKARAAYERALTLNPANTHSLINLALVYERLGRLVLARRALERVLVHEPDNPEAHYNLARLLDGQEDHAAALEHYLCFLALKPSDYPQLRQAVESRVRHLQARLN
ncbi:MAG: tetratricopeptide repeat protein [Syntrophobacteria bacterium]